LIEIYLLFALLFMCF